MDAPRAAGTVALLRQAVLALAVLDDVDVAPRDDGVDFASGGHLSWPDVACALGPWSAQPAHPVARRRLRVASEVVGILAVGGPEALLETCHAHGEPEGAVMSGRTAWVREVVPGGSLVLGLGVSDLGRVVGPHPLPPLPSLQLVLGPRLDARWQEQRLDLERLGGLVVTRLARDCAEGRHQVLRPTGRADVVTLLGSRRLRTHLAEGDGTGMRAVAVPVRDRGWFDLARIDPAYVGAAYSATATLGRAFDRPLLVTADAVGTPVASGDVLAGVLADPAGTTSDRQLRHS